MRSAVSDRSVRTKLLATVGLVCVFVLTVGLVGLQSLVTSSRRVNSMYTQVALSISASDDINTAYLNLKIDLRNKAIAQGAAATAAQQAALVHDDGVLDDAIATYRALNTGHDDLLNRLVADVAR